MALFIRKSRSIKKILSEFFVKARYRRLALVGSGGIAEITSSFDQQLYRVIACKTLQPKSFENPHLIRAFLTEARLMSFLDHPGIVPIYDAMMQDDGRMCYTMKLVDGMRLSSVLKYASFSSGQDSMPINRLIDIFIKICETLSYAHSMGVIHLDIKPDNILIGKYGEVLVLDWGNARLYDKKPYENFFKHHLGDSVNLDFEQDLNTIILGTPDYMSPEQTNTPRDQLTPASDIFSSGIILYQMLTGEQPFSDFEETREIMTSIRSFTPVEPHLVNSDIPIRLSRICSRMLNKNPEDRYPSFEAVLADFTEFYNSGHAFSIREYQKGEVIMEEGDKGDFAFKILSGTVEVTKMVDNVRKVLNVLGPGQNVGELAVFSKQPRSATITALEPCEIRIMGRSAVEKELEKLSPWVGSMVKTLSERFIDLNEESARLRT